MFWHVWSRPRNRREGPPEACNTWKCTFPFRFVSGRGLTMADAPSNCKQCEVRNTPVREKRAWNTGWSIPHAILPLEKFPIVNRISSNTRIDPVMPIWPIWRRVRGGPFIQGILLPARTPVRAVPHEYHCHLTGHMTDDTYVIGV